MNKSRFQLSILTPVRVDANPEHLTEAWQSVQGLDSSISWEWVVQLDGENKNLFEMIQNMTKGHPVLINDYDRSYGAAVARNTALALSEGNWVLALDSDDWLLADGVKKQVIIAKEGKYQWVTGPALRSFVDKTEPRPSPFKEGEIPVGSVAKEWKRANEKMPILATPIMYQKDLVMYFGGWPALPRSEDVGLLHAINRLQPGFMTGEPFYVYRKWTGQTTAGNQDPRIRKAVLKHREDWDSALRRDPFLL
jgi:glycosyltransferase involved in cell wall biosynthesis